MASGLKDVNAAADLFPQQPAPQHPRPPAYHEGHRQRLRERFANAGPGALADYELLELLLFYGIPRRDTKPLAKDLIARFNSFAEVINAPPERLKEVKGIGDGAAEFLQIVQAAALRLMKVELDKRDILSSWHDVVNYCRNSIGFKEIEEFHVVFLNKRNRIIAIELQQKGTVDHTPAYPREIVKRALEHAATAVILVHNHPSGDTTPSQADIEMTKAIMEAGKPLKINVHDHLIVGRNGYSSLRQMQLM